MLRPVKKAVVSLGLMPKSMRGKKLLKRIVFGNLVQMLAEITANTCEYRRLQFKKEFQTKSLK